MGKHNRSNSIIRARRGSIKRWLWNKSQDELASKEKRIGNAGHVYVFSLGYDDLYKIGKASNILSRLKDLQASNPRLKCVWSAYAKDNSKLESIIHKKMKTYLVGREIFKFSPDKIMKINEIANSYKERTS